MHPVLRRAIDTSSAWLHRAIALVRHHPLRSAMLLPLLLPLYALLLVPFTPGIDDLRRARIESPSMLLSTDGMVLAEYRRINREWVPLDRIAPSV